jgi:hypothetical protein
MPEAITESDEHLLDQLQEALSRHSGLARSRWAGSPSRMNKISYSGYRFPREIIRQAIWLYLRFTLSLRDVEDLLAQRGVAVSYETVGVG